MIQPHIGRGEGHAPVCPLVEVLHHALLPLAASKVLGPLWNKVSILRYRITGPIDQPQINEVLRQARSNKKQ